MKTLARLILLCALCFSSQAAQWFCSTNGTGTGASLGSPFLLQTAITDGSIAPGDTVWLLGGTYFPTATFAFGNVNRQGWAPGINGSAGNQITIASYPGQWAAIDRLWTLVGCSYLCFSNLEFYDSLKGHNLTNSTGPPPPPPWVHFPMGANVGFSWVNCVIHDVDDCFGQASAYSVRGCVFWYVGWNVLEHVCYPAPTNFTGNISAWHLQNVINFNVANALIESNIMFGGGATESAIPSASSDIDGIGYNETIDHNYTYNRLNTSITAVALNMNSAASGTVSIFDNIWTGPVPILQLGYGTFGTVSIMNDTNYASSSNYQAGVMVWATISGASVDYNSYFAVPSENSPNLPVFTLNGTYNNSFASWKSSTGFDAHSTIGTAGQMPPNFVQVLPNQDVPKRANIAIYNWTQANNVTVSLAGVLSSGDTYNLYSAQNYNQSNVSGPVPVATGTYNGTSISVGMTNLSVAPILYGQNTSSDGVQITQPPSPSPEFGAFVVQGQASGSSYTVTASAGTGGTVTPTSVSVASGANQVFTATPAMYYSVYQWLLDSTVVQTGGASYTLANVTATHAVQVTFTRSGPGTFYFDAASGLDWPTNTGVSEASPWQHHPYMANGTSGGYTHAAGDRFVFRGGVDWSACWPMLITAGGTSGQSDYYGVDKSWFTGGSWSRPIFDGAASPLDTLSPNCQVQTTAPYMAFDGLHFTNANWSGSMLAPGSVQILNVALSAGLNSVIITNCVFDGFAPTGSGDDALACVNFYNGFVQPGSRVTGCAFTGPANASASWGYAVYGGCQTFDNNFVSWMPNGFVGLVQFLSNNAAAYMCASITAGVHNNAFNAMVMPDTNSFFHHNVISNGSSGELWFISTLGVFTNHTATNYFFDNLCFNNSNQQPAVVLDPGWNTNGQIGTFIAWNNTLQSALGGIGGEAGIYAPVYTSQSPKYACWSNILCENVHFINEAGVGVSIQTAGGLPNTLLAQDHNLTNSNAAATTAGYTQANLYQPTSIGSPTVGAGFSFPFTSGTVTSDLHGLPRFLPMDIGAYQVQSNIVVASSGLGGSINPTGAVAVPFGGSATFTASPSGGFTVLQWLLDGSPVQTGGSPYTLSGSSANHTLEVTFTSIPQPSASTAIQVVPGGTITIQFAPAGGGGSVIITR